MATVSILMTQVLFKDAPPSVKSAVMDSKGDIWLFECRKKHLTANHRSWVSDIETGFYFHSGAHNANGWQDSAIDKDLLGEFSDDEIAELKRKYGGKCSICGSKVDNHERN